MTMEEFAPLIEGLTAEQVKGILANTQLNTLGEKLAGLENKIVSLEESKETKTPPEPEVDSFDQYLKDSGYIK